MATLADLPLAKERRLFWILAVFSGLVWLACIASVIGIVIGAIFALLAFFMNGLFVARIKSESVEVTPQQLPELYQFFADSCDRVQMQVIPRLYIMQQGGWLNAFATRFARRNFVVLYSDLVEAFDPNSKELQFIIGHELGHIKQKHLIWGVFVMPGMLLPLLGSAYSRARESTCDRYGAFVAQDTNASMRATLALAGGKQLYRVLDPLVFAQQHESERGFFISLHELLSTYPTMSKRVSDIRVFADNAPAPKAARNPFAYAFALMAFGPGTIILIYLAFLYFVLMDTGLLGKLKEQITIANESTQEAAALKGVWILEGDSLVIEVDDNEITLAVRCEDGSIVEVPSPASFTESNLIIEKSNIQKKMVEGKECLARLDAGSIPYVVNSEDELVLGAGENALNFRRAENS